ncbi:hypothetical protein HPB50_026424 [Hyalomma asiaticum]|uniref:Uncharacterized protein n=1 Tax=Hyalomma asiaticum TaxID=266040 RepID=A0ACB7RTY3_HYAAI|nr:hypothetical protein HPB50_026424 [Hyalomma asiaticum]
MHIFHIDHGFEFLPARRVLAADGLHTSFEGTALLASHIKDVSFCEKRYTRSEWNEPTVAETAAAETTEIPLTSQEEFPRLPPPPPHPAPSLPHGPGLDLVFARWRYVTFRLRLVDGAQAA